MEPTPHLDLLHTSPVVTTALRRELRSGPHAVRVDTAAHSWTDFQREWDFAGEVVVLDAMLDDHVPLPLKVRALQRLGSRAVVLGPGRSTPFARRVAARGPSRGSSRPRACPRRPSSSARSPGARSRTP